ncbi:MAG: glycosyltransferase family 2 protein [Clostridiales bacterium]|nr:glycosyltransferase family 2 protein [Clostridiales bacterium]
MDQYLISVVIPGYKCENTIVQAVRSALEQNEPVEVIVVDDHSPMPLEPILEPFREDGRVRYFRNKENMGVAVSRNRGVQEARGNYIAFLDADDWWEPGKLSAQRLLMEKEGVVLSCTARELMNHDGQSRNKVIPVPEIITYRTLLSHNCINCSSVLMKTEVAREFPMEYDEAHEDYIMWLRILKKYGKVAGINHPYLKYRMAAGSKSGNKWKSAVMTYRVYRYMGYSHLKSMVLFFSYAVHGIIKYW